MSSARRGKKPWNKGVVMPPDFGFKMAELSKKFWSDPANKEKIEVRNGKIAESKKGDKNPMKRPEVVRKRSLKMFGKLVGDKNPARNPEVRKKISSILLGHKVSEATRSRISKSLEGKLVGELNPFYGKRHSLIVREKSRVRAISQLISGLLKNRRTSIEIKVASELRKRNIDFVEQYPIANITVVDFYLPRHKVAIYCDGEFWHKSEWAKKNGVIGKDIAQNRYLENAGYKVFRFDESEINLSISDCMNRLSGYLDSDTL